MHSAWLAPYGFKRRKRAGMSDQAVTGQVAVGFHKATSHTDFPGVWCSSVTCYGFVIKSVLTD
jgi:hypothetical protein